MKEANDALQHTINKYMEENMDEIKLELKNSQIPEDEYPEYLATIRRRLQVEGIKLFKIELENVGEIQKQNQQNKCK